MNQKNLDRKIGKLLKSPLGQKQSKPQPACPAEARLSDYLQNKLPPQESEALSSHIANCAACLDLMAAAYRGDKIFNELTQRPSAAAINKAKGVAMRKNLGKNDKIKRIIYPCLSALAFLLSFLFPQYFLQFLFIALLFGLKWVFETGSTRTLIMIYQAWQKKDTTQARKIAEDLKERFGIKR